MSDRPDSTSSPDSPSEGAVSYDAKADAPGSFYDLREARDLTKDRDSGDLFSRARMQWQFGDWNSLRKLDLLHIEYHPERAELALLAGCAALQVGEREQARTFLTSSIEWGCNRRLIFRLLVSGVYNGMGRYHALTGDREKEQRFFELAGRGLGGDPNLIGEVRRQRELLALPQQTGEKVTPLQTEHEPLAVAITEAAGKAAPPTLRDAIAEAIVHPGHPTVPGIRSYAQNFEDVMLWRTLGHIEKGFYIDVGAQDPVTHSVSKAFYDHGWRGLHVEATRGYAKLLRENRPDEAVIEAAVSDHHGSITFFEITDTGISTGDPDIAAMHRAKGYPVREVVVPTITMDDLFGFAGSSEIHWLKIDVEGMEGTVLHGWRGDTHRPWVVVVESSIPGSQVETRDFWEHLLLRKGYTFAYFDGLSRFYVAREHAELIEVLKLPPNTFDSFVQVR